ncbi:MAG: DEAD/DEAH box helicase [Thermoanaerobaculia bacterium]|nr:DEAD/DEAH box helicase [Thermoanaerobaculia bacterium]
MASLDAAAVSTPRPHIQLALQFVRQAPFLPSAGDQRSGDAAVQLAVASSAVEPWPHQLAVAHRATTSYPQGFLFCDEVGLGKTVEAGLALRSLWISRRVRRALLLVPAALLRQWHEELLEKFALPIARFDGERFLDVVGRELPRKAGDSRNPWNLHRLVLASSQLVRRRERARELLAADPWDLVIVDEAHHARRRDPGSEGFRPNRLLELLGGRTSRSEGEGGLETQGLTHRSRCLWLLTATPMQIHPDELWDLLRLVGSPPPPVAEETWADARWRSRLFRHTREVLRRYHREGLLDTVVPTRRPENVWIELGEDARSVYRRIETYLSLFYRRYEAERRGLGFVMTVYRRRLTSSFEAIRRSLVRRRKSLMSGEIAEADGARDRADSLEEGETSEPGPGLFDSAAGADELSHLDGFLGELALLDVDPKVEQLRADLRRLLAQRDRAIVFTQYLDTLDHLRGALASEWRVACWSGRGAEVESEGRWSTQGKEELKAAFGRGEIQVLLATDAASEGLNLQSCGLLINFDMPWNPMRVEQRIGRIDRIGQHHREVWIRSYFYSGTVEAEVHRRLADRIRWFEDVVGTLQPILQQVGQTVADVAMQLPGRRGRRLEERLQALGQTLEESRSTPQVELKGDEQAESGMSVDYVTNQAPVSVRQVEETVLAAAGERFSVAGPDVFDLRFEGKVRRVTFQPDVYDAHPYSTRLLTWGVPLFERLLDRLLDAEDEESPWTVDKPAGVGMYRSERPAPVTLFLHPGGEARSLATLTSLAESAPRAWRPHEEAEAASRFSALRRRALQVRESIEAERRKTERADLRRTAEDLLVRLALLELVDAESPTLFDSSLPWGFGVRAVRELRRHGRPLEELVERLDDAGGLPAAQPDDRFYIEARGHRPGWRERRRRVLMLQAEDCQRRLEVLDAAEAEARRRVDEPSAGLLDRRWFRTAVAAEAGPRFLGAEDVDTFVMAVPVLGPFQDASLRIREAADEGRDLLSEIRSDPEAETWLVVEGRAGERRFAAQASDDDMSPRIAEGDWCLFESTIRAPMEGEMLLILTSGKTVLRRVRCRGSTLVLEANAPGRTLTLQEPDPESVQVLARFLGKV